MDFYMAKTVKQIKRIFIGIAGATVLAIGLIMILTPGPAFLVIPIGLSILATEFEFMRKIENRFKLQMEKLKNKVMNN
jgi:uncharacterized protein (TIGR02611 family)